MPTEYKIEAQLPKDYDPSSVLGQLPSPIGTYMREIYNYAVHKDGFYLLDNHIDARVSGYAMKLFIDEALQFSEEARVRVLTRHAAQSAR
jgi:hypothetical protein